MKNAIKVFIFNCFRCFSFYPLSYFPQGGNGHLPPPAGGEGWEGGIKKGNLCY